MSSYLLLIGALLLGGAIGYFSKKDLDKYYKPLLMVTILVLIFFMGANLGLSDNLSEKLVKFGYASFVITTSSVFFSIFTAALILYLYNKNRSKE